MGDTTESFLETAAIMKSLDLVVSVDTVVPHVAGALGVPVWLALPFAPDWRWRQAGETTPWYPTMRIFRQPSRGQWEPVFENIRTDLAWLASGCLKVDSNCLEIPVSPGELIDRIANCEIELDRSRDSTTSNAHRELEILQSIRDRRLLNSPPLTELAARLKGINKLRWEMKDEFQDCERRQDFGSHFIELARSIRRTNEARSQLKREIDCLLGASLAEETH